MCETMLVHYNRLNQSGKLQTNAWERKDSLCNERKIMEAGVIDYIANTRRMAHKERICETNRADMRTTLKSANARNYAM